VRQLYPLSNLAVFIANSIVLFPIKTAIGLEDKNSKFSYKYGQRLKDICRSAFDWTYKYLASCWGVSTNLSMVSTNWFK